jgi:hypothetical protein
MAGILLRDDSCKSEAPHTTQLDGPYVLYKGDTILVNYILDDHGTKKVKQDIFLAPARPTISLTVLTDEPGRSFPVQLKSKLVAEETDYSKVTRRFIISDIESNFKAFRQLLQAHHIIDSAFNWSFGDGHLVLTGDFVDRGEQQNEVLWLIYSLEEKAKAAGGYVHYILGNHEIMNMSGDLRYLQPKYLEHAKLMNESWPSVYGENSELGRWLRTKNVMEKVGDILFCHGGVSAAVNRMDLNTSKLNKLVRPYYADTTYIYDRPETDTLYSDLGPFWYRGYYTGTVKASPAQIDSTLKAYKVKHVATGHTVIAETISILYDGKVINTDVHHAKGHTEALFIEGDNYFRALPTGEKIPVSIK